jgi:hypothetical protein
MNTQLVDSIIQLINSLSAEEKQAIDEEAQEVWRTLGDDAAAGCLPNTSINHDRYLYSSSLSNWYQTLNLQNHYGNLNH